MTSAMMAPDAKSKEAQLPDRNLLSSIGLPHLEDVVYHLEAVDLTLCTLRVSECIMTFVIIRQR